jgi:class 3 adenylate cyclase
MKRRISAILAADIVGYSRLAAADEEDTVRRLAVCRKVFDEATAQHGGQVVNMVGDAILAQFPTSIDAIRCAINAQESNRIKNLDYPPSRKMNFRIGITVGDIIDREGQIFGESVNIAARLESLAPPGGICVSKTVYEHVVNDLSAAFEDIGEQRVKNIPDPIHAYVIAPYQESRAGMGRGPQKNAARQRRYRLAIGAALAVVMVAVLIATALHLSGSR